MTYYYDDSCQHGFNIDHTDWWYDGYYYQDGYWNGVQHYTDGMGAHLYWYPSSGNSGYWKFDNRSQGGSHDWYDGGYFFCANGYNHCDGDDTFWWSGEIDRYFNGAGTIHFSEVYDCSYALAGAQGSQGYSTTTFAAGAVVGAALLGAVRYMSKRSDNYN